MSAPNPVLVQVTRGDAVESIHRGRAVVMEASGKVIAAWGEVDTPVYPRSAIKPIQALPLILSGAADAFGLTDEEIALACASHRGQPEHVAAVSRWLDRLGLGVGDLECAAHPPKDDGAARALVRVGEDPTPAHNNCSGKHAGFLTTALHLGRPTKGYMGADHGVQEGWIGELARLSGVDLTGLPRGTDGCGIPTIALPLTGLARAMALMADPARLDGVRAAAILRITAAMTAHPFLVGGRDAFDTVAMEAGSGAFITKVGAEGVYAGALFNRGFGPGSGPGLGPGLGIALKIDDGAKRASEVAMAALLDHLGGLDDGARKKMERFLEPPVLNVAGKPVGVIRPAPGWPA